MPASDILEAVFREVGQVVLDIVCDATGRVIVPAATFGRYRVEPVSGGPPPVGTKTISARAGSLWGLAFWVTIAASAIAGFVWWSG